MRHAFQFQALNIPDVNALACEACPAFGKDRYVATVCFASNKTFLVPKGGPADSELGVGVTLSSPSRLNQSKSGQIRRVAPGGLVMKDKHTHTQGFST